ATASGEEKKEAAIDLPAADVGAMLRNDGIAEADAKKKWAGKRVALTTLRWGSNREAGKGEPAGRTLFYFEVGEAKTGKPTSLRLPVFVKDEKDTTTLKNLRWWNKRPLVLHGKLRIDYTSHLRVWMEDARLVRDPKEAAKEEKEIKEGLEALQNPL